MVYFIIFNSIFFITYILYLSSNMGLLAFLFLPFGLINSKLIDNLKLSKKCRVLIVYLLIFYMVTAVIKNNFIYIIH